MEENNSKEDYSFDFGDIEHIKTNIEKLTIDEYNSIIKDYKFNENIHLTKRLRWLEKQIDKNTKNKYVKKEIVNKMIQKICKDLNIKSLSFNNFPF